MAILVTCRKAAGEATETLQSFHTVNSSMLFLNILPGQLMQLYHHSWCPHSYLFDMTASCQSCLPNLQCCLTMVHAGTTGQLPLAASRRDSVSSTAVSVQGSDGKDDSTACVAVKCGVTDSTPCKFALYVVKCLLIT